MYNNMHMNMVNNNNNEGVQECIAQLSTLAYQTQQLQLNTNLQLYALNHIDVEYESGHLPQHKIKKQYLLDGHTNTQKFALYRQIKREMRQEIGQLKRELQTNYKNLNSIRKYKSQCEQLCTQIRVISRQNNSNLKSLKRRQHIIEEMDDKMQQLQELVFNHQTQVLKQQQSYMYQAQQQSLYNKYQQLYQYKQQLNHTILNHHQQHIHIQQQTYRQLQEQEQKQKSITQLYNNIIIHIKQQNQIIDSIMDRQEISLNHILKEESSDDDDDEFTHSKKHKSHSKRYKTQKQQSQQFKFPISEHVSFKVPSSISQMIKQKKKLEKSISILPTVLDKRRKTKTQIKKKKQSYSQELAKNKELFRELQKKKRIKTRYSFDSSQQFNFQRPNQHQNQDKKSTIIRIYEDLLKNENNTKKQSETQLTRNKGKIPQEQQQQSQHQYGYEKLKQPLKIRRKFKTNRKQEKRVVEHRESDNEVRGWHP